MLRRLSGKQRGPRRPRPLKGICRTQKESKYANKIPGLRDLFGEERRRKLQKRYERKWPPRNRAKKGDKTNAKKADAVPKVSGQVKQVSGRVITYAQRVEIFPEHDNKPVNLSHVHNDTISDSSPLEPVVETPPSVADVQAVAKEGDKFLYSLDDGNDGDIKSLYDNERPEYSPFSASTMAYTPTYSPSVFVDEGEAQER